MAYRKKTGGRKAGTPNKISGSLKSMILDSLIEVGGKDYLKTQAKSNPQSYMTLIGKVLPLSLDTEGGKLTVTWEK